MSATCSGTTRQNQPCQNTVANPGGVCGRCKGPAGVGGAGDDRADGIDDDAYETERAEFAEWRSSLDEGVANLTEALGEGYAVGRPTVSHDDPTVVSMSVTDPDGEHWEWTYVDGYVEATANSNPYLVWDAVVETDDAAGVMEDANAILERFGSTGLDGNFPDVEAVREQAGRAEVEIAKEFAAEGYEVTAVSGYSSNSGQGTITVHFTTPDGSEMLIDRDTHSGSEELLEEGGGFRIPSDNPVARDLQQGMFEGSLQEIQSIYLRYGSFGVEQISV